MLCANHWLVQYVLGWWDKQIRLYYYLQFTCNIYWYILVVEVAIELPFARDIANLLVYCKILHLIFEIDFMTYIPLFCKDTVMRIIL